MALASPVRLVFCITELDLGGAERALTQLVLSLNRNHWEPHVICLGPSGHFVPVLEAAGIPVTCLNAKGILSVPRVIFTLVRQFGRIRPALVQTFLFHANILGRIAAVFARVPHVVSGLRVAEHQSRWHGTVDRWTNSLVEMNVCVSQGVAEFSRQVTRLPAEKLRVIPNSVDANRFANAQPADLSSFGIPNSSTVFITIGRLEKQKGIDLLLIAIKQLMPLRSLVHFLIVGDGPDANQLKQQAEQMQLNQYVHFSGSRQDVPQLLAAASALVLPSRWEGMPNVVLEAMAAGRPIISTRVEGVEELIQDGVTGLIVPPEQPAHLTSAISQFIDNPQLFPHAEKLAQDIISKQFTAESISKKYSDLYRALID